MPPRGVLLSDSLAGILDVRAGDTITVEVLEGSRPVRRLEVSGIVQDLMGTNAYMDIHALNRLMNEDDVISGAYLMVDARQEDELFMRLKRMPAVAGVGLPAAILKGFNETFARTIGVFTFVLVSFASAIVFGVVYNAARIALSERGRELASLRVLGFTLSRDRRYIARRTGGPDRAGDTFGLRCRRCALLGNERSRRFRNAAAAVSIQQKDVFLDRRYWSLSRLLFRAYSCRGGCEGST